MLCGTTSLCALKCGILGGLWLAQPPLLSALFVQGGRNRLDRWQGLAQASCRIPFPWSHCGLGVGARELPQRQGSLTPQLFPLPSSCPRTAVCVCVWGGEFQAQLGVSRQGPGLRPTLPPFPSLSLPGPLSPRGPFML